MKMNSLKKCIAAIVVAGVVIVSGASEAMLPGFQITANAVETSKSAYKAEIKRLDKKILQLKKKRDKLKRQYKAAVKAGKINNSKNLNLIIGGDILCNNPFIVRDDATGTYYCFKDTKHANTFFSKVAYTIVKPVGGTTRYNDVNAINVKTVNGGKSSLEKKLDKAEKSLNTAKKKRNAYKDALKTTIESEYGSWDIELDDDALLWDEDDPVFLLSSDSEYADFDVTFDDDSIAEWQVDDDDNSYIHAKKIGTTKMTVKMLPSGSKASVVINVVPKSDDGDSDDEE